MSKKVFLHHLVGCFILKSNPLICMYMEYISFLCVKQDTTWIWLAFEWMTVMCFVCLIKISLSMQLFTKAFKVTIQWYKKVVKLNWKKVSMRIFLILHKLTSCIKLWNNLSPLKSNVDVDVSAILIQNKNSIRITILFLNFVFTKIDSCDCHEILLLSFVYVLDLFYSHSN